MSEALQLYLSEIKITAKFFKYLGFDFIREDFQLNIMFIIMILDIIVFIQLQFYSLYYFRDNFLEFFKVLAILGYLFQAISITWSFYSNRKFFWELHLSFVEFHKKYDKRRILFKYNKKVKRFIDFLTIVFAVSFLICVIYPIIGTILEKKKVLSFAFILPFVDHKTDFGHLINFVFQSGQIVLTAFMYGSFCRIYWQLFGNALVRVELLKEVVNEFKENILDYVDEDLGGNHQQLSLKLKEIVEIHLGYLRLKVLPNIFGG